MVLDDARVSWRHATISWGGRGWVIEDHGSTNGTFVQGQRIQQMEIGPGSAVHLGNATDGPRLNFSGGRRTRRRDAASSRDAAGPQPGAAAAQPRQRPSRSTAGPAAAAAAQAAAAGRQQPQQQPQVPRSSRWPAAGGPGGAAGAPPVYGDRSPTTFHQLALGRVMRIGRALENELVVSDLQVSRNHAEFHAHARRPLRDPRPRLATTAHTSTASRCPRPARR